MAAMRMTGAAALWLARLPLTMLVAAGSALIWLGYFACFPRRAAGRWARLRPYA